MDRTGWAIWHTALAVDSLYRYVTDIHNLAAVFTELHTFRRSIAWIKSHLGKQTTITNYITKSIVHPIASPVGAAIRVDEADQAPASTRSSFCAATWIRPPADWSCP